MQRLALLWDFAGCRKKRRLIQLTAVHVSGTIHQIVCFIHQKNIVSLFHKKTFQIHPRIKYIVIVTDNHIPIQTCIKAQLKGTDQMLLCFFFNGLTIDELCFLQQLIQGILTAIIIALCIGTYLGVTVTHILKADFILGCDCHAFKGYLLVVKQSQSIIGNCGRYIFRTQIKYLFRLSLSNCLQRRKQGGNCLSDTGWCGGEQLFPIQNGFVYGDCKVTLSAAIIRKRKLQLLQCSGRADSLLSAAHFT